MTRPSLWNRLRRRRLPMLFQGESSECGVACLAMVARYFGVDVSVAALRKRFAVSLEGLSLGRLLRIAPEMGLRTNASRCDLPGLAALKLPALLHWDLCHMVVLRKISGGILTIHDPARGIRRLTTAEASNHFTGIAIELSRGGEISWSAPAERLTFRRLIGSLRSFRLIFFQIVSLSAVLELLLFSQPLFIRAIVDVGVANEDARFLAAACGILALSSILHAGCSYLRDDLVLKAGTSLNHQMMRGVFAHALRLPLAFFEKRSIGHLVERYRVTDDIERVLVSGLPLALIDGLVTLVSVGIVSWLSPLLGLLSMITAGLYAAAKYAGYSNARGREESLVWAKGEENGHLIETLRTIFTTKVNGLEEARLWGWTGHYRTLIDAQRKHGLVENAYRALRYALSGANVAVFVLYTGTSAIRGTVSIGTMLAALFYNAHLLARSAAFVERVFELRLLRVRLDRLEDIVLAEAEEDAVPRIEPAPAAPPPGWAPQGRLSLERVSFGYGSLDRLILKDVSCEIGRGEMIALIGPNGAGKTTLLKLMLGLYQPSSGRVLHDGYDLRGIPVAALRSSVGVVTQDDQLFNGTVAQNIALFDPVADLDRIAEAAELACVRQDIERLPMGYHTRMGQLGSMFSEGQKQKLFLARALYRRPRFLLMDEGTANLDGEAEEKVLERLRSSPATKILIAHRAAALHFADRILRLRDGVLEEVGPDAVKGTADALRAS